MNLKIAAIFLTGTLLANIVMAQAPDYNTRINLLSTGINTQLTDNKTGLYFESTDKAKNENPHSWLWPLCALIQATNEMEVLSPESSYMAPVVKAIDQYYNDKPPVPGYQDYVTKERLSSRFYDDNEWVAIAYLDAYNRNHQKKYLDDAKMIYRFIMSGLDTAAGGGLYWKEGDKTTKNTCSNGPAILVALQLYKITKDKTYLNTALNIYKWTNEHLQSPDGIYYDNIKVGSLAISKATYTYNTGTMLQSNVLFYNLTKEKRYLTEAERIAKAGKDHFFKNDRLPDNYWFNAVMLRGYIELYKVDHNQQWAAFFKTDADGIWNTERDASNMVGSKPAKTLIDQAAMIEIYARLLQVQANKQ
jgi:uncharacterized protein YyaL (SSP411 family)